MTGQALVRSSGTEHRGPVMKVDLVVENARWWPDPALVTLAHGDVCR
jgi:hypothetical protein